MDGFPSGQREQTVNLPSQTSMVRIHPHPPAGMAELADAHGSGPCESNFMQVQVLFPAPEKALASASAFFSYIRLRRVKLRYSYIRLTPSDIPCGGDTRLRHMRERILYHMIVNLIDDVSAPKSSYMTDQLARAGTSVGANIHEAQYAHSKREPII